MRRLTKLALATALLISVAAGIAALMVTPAEAGRCLCPQVYAPVECDKGKVYPNQCVADCRRARNCVPIGAI